MATVYLVEYFRYRGVLLLLLTKSIAVVFLGVSTRSAPTCPGSSRSPASATPRWALAVVWLRRARGAAARGHGAAAVRRRDSLALLGPRGARRPPAGARRPTARARVALAGPADRRPRRRLDTPASPSSSCARPAGSHARSLLCTHFGCRVVWEPARGQRYRCPCHQGWFDADGRPVAGPPTAAAARGAGRARRRRRRSSASGERPAARRHRRLGLRRPPPARGAEGGLPHRRHGAPQPGALRRARPPEHPAGTRSTSATARRSRRSSRSIRREGGADVLLHLAAHYDFTGEEHPEYWRTNVQGLRNVLDLSKGLGLQALRLLELDRGLRLPAAGPGPDRDEPAGRRPRLRAHARRSASDCSRSTRAHFPSTIVRFAALFSDWCEYPPLFMFLETWLSGAWNARVLGGRGRSAIPYLHVDDLVLFFLALLDRLPTRWRRARCCRRARTAAVSHRAAVRRGDARSATGAAARPIHMPRALCGPGMWGLDLRRAADRPPARSSGPGWRATSTSR